MTGQHTYEIEYRIRGGLNHFEDHDELNYNVTGDQWDVPIDQVRATVTLPSGTVDRTTCFAGPRGSQLAVRRALGSRARRPRSATAPSAPRGHDRRRRLPDGHRAHPGADPRGALDAAAGVRRAHQHPRPRRRPARRGSARRGRGGVQGGPGPSLRRLTDRRGVRWRRSPRAERPAAAAARSPSSSCRPTACDRVRSARSSTSRPIRSTSRRRSSTSRFVATCASRRSRRRSGSGTPTGGS